MIKEEYNYDDLQQYLNSNIDLLIVGFANEEDRSHFFLAKWNHLNKDILCLSRNDNQIHFAHIHNQTAIRQNDTDLCTGIPMILKELKVDEKNILIDLSSLDHVLIMFLSKQLLTRIVPKTLFASYIRPKKYCNQSGCVGFSLSDQILAIGSVPGFSKREQDSHTLCTFLGFEGSRLKQILETTHNINKFIPIVAFPSGSPEWYNVTMLNCMDILQTESIENGIYKCFSESIYEAVKILTDTIQQDEKLILAPLGTRPHSMASAIFACQHTNTRIIYDFAIESSQRTTGIERITIYHLSSFLRT